VIAEFVPFQLRIVIHSFNIFRLRAVNMYNGQDFSSVRVT